MICCISASTPPPPPLLSPSLPAADVTHTMAAYQARYDYSGTAPGMLSFRSGDKFTVKNRTNDDWWTVQDDKGEMGLVPVSYLEPLPVRLSFIFLLLQTSFIFVFFFNASFRIPSAEETPSLSSVEFTFVFLSTCTHTPFLVSRIPPSKFLASLMILLYVRN